VRESDGMPTRSNFRQDALALSPVVGASSCFGRRGASISMPCELNRFPYYGTDAVDRRGVWRWKRCARIDSQLMMRKLRRLLEAVAMTSRLNLIVLGKQGAGKGTQSAVLCEKYAIRTSRPVDILRNAVKAGSELGKEGRLDPRRPGDLVSDDIVNQLVEERFKEGRRAARRVARRLSAHDRPSRGARSQCSADDGIQALHSTWTWPIELVTPAALVADESVRSAARPIATVTSKRSRARCSNCGGDVIQRTDDYPEVDPHPD